MIMVNNEVMGVFFHCVAGCSHFNRGKWHPPRWVASKQKGSFSFPWLREEGYRNNIEQQLALEYCECVAFPKSSIINNDTVSWWKKYLVFQLRYTVVYTIWTNETPFQKWKIIYIKFIKLVWCCLFLLIVLIAFVCVLVLFVGVENPQSWTAGWTTRTDRVGAQTWSNWGRKLAGRRCWCGVPKSSFYIFNRYYHQKLT